MTPRRAYQVDMTIRLVVTLALISLTFAIYLLAITGNACPKTMFC